jgi:hypothetical protein
VLVKERLCKGIMKGNVVLIKKLNIGCCFGCVGYEQEYEHKQG